MSTTPFWKKINQTVSGYSQSITEDIVAEILKLSKNELLEGLLTYKPYTKKGFDDWFSNADVSSCMKEFLHELSQDINLDTSVAYPVMCNYLMFEYYGKIKEFWQVTRIGTSVHLKESIWNFYTAERMFLLKTWRHIFEFVDKDYEFAEQYQDFLKSIKIEDLQNNLIKQFEHLVNEITLKNTDEMMEKRYENWLCRNCREQIELTLILTLTTKHRSFDTTQLTNLIKLFIQNNFGTQAPYYEVTQLLSKKDLHELMCAEIGCYFVVVENMWDVTHDFWKSSSTTALKKSLVNLHLNPGHTLIMLVWLMLKFKSENQERDSVKIMELFKRKPLILLHSIVSDDIYQNCTVGEVVIKAAHKMMDELCLMFNDRKVLYEEEGLVPIIGEFLKHANLAELCLKTRNGLDSIMEIAIESFPYDFYSFTAISHALLGQKTEYKNTIYLLNNIPSFLSDMTWTSAKDRISVLKRSQRAFPDSDLIVFPPKTVVKSYAIFGKNLIQYKGTFNYFLYLEYLVNLMINIGIQHKKFTESLVKKVIAGYNVVIQGIKNCVDMDLEIIGIQRSIEKLNKILIILEGPLLHFDLVKLYFDVYSAMMVYRKCNFFEFCPEFVWKVFFPKLKAEYKGTDVKKLLFNQYLFEDTIFVHLFKQEECKEDHTLILNYIEILFSIMKVKFQFKNFQFSGVAYLFNYVFLQHQGWTYKDENQKSKITLGCLNIFHYILQKKSDELTEEEKQIFDLCHHAFLNNHYIIESFLRLFIKDKYYLIYLMERESNWVKGHSLDKLQCIRMQLALLLIIMNHRKVIADCNFSQKLPLIVKPVASYFTNSYSPVIAELSCRFLEKLAQDQYIPLLALLELDHYQVQSLFLERLRDPLEEENVKLAIIDLINTCIANQNGMTAAFFNLKCFMYWDGTENDVFTGDSVSDFMVDYLQNIKKSHEYFKNPLQLGILRLLYNLWLNHRENLIDNIANLKDFWPVMLDPFFCDFVQEVEVYTVILRIVNLEIGANIDNVEKKLVDALDKFLKNKDQLNLWIKFVHKASHSTTKDHHELLHTWMEFLVLTKKIMPNSFDEDTKVAIIISCLDGVTSPLTSFSNIEIVYLYLQLYLLLIQTWSIYEKRERIILEKLTRFLHSLNAYYKYLTPKIKEAVLCTINKTIMDLKEFFNCYTTSLVSFLYSVGTVIDSEHDFLVSTVWYTEDDLEKITLLKPWLIIIFIGNTLLTLDNVDEIALWFWYRQFLKRVLNSVGPMLKTRSTVPFAKLAIDHLITYAQSSLGQDFLKVDLFDFYYELRPPPLTISVGEAILSGVPVNLKEWWLIFITLIKFTRILMENLGARMLETCFTFISQHDQLLKEIITLTKYTVDMTALTLVCETLKFVYVVLGALPSWSMKYTSSYELIMDGIRTTINAGTLSILGYKKINFYNIVHGKQLSVIDCPPTELLVSVLNKLIEIIFWGCSCLKKGKPDLLEVLSVCYDPTAVFTIWIDNDFSVPRFELPITARLTYGMLLCLAHCLCKTLNQLSPETPTAIPRTRQVSMTDLQDEIKLKNLAEIFEHCTATYEKCIGFMVYLQRSDDLPNEKLSSFLHYDMSEVSTSTSATTQLDYYMVKNALEALMTFLAGEVFANITILSFDEESLFAYKRELSSEIQFFYEFVRKRTSEQYNAIATTPRASLTSLQSGSTATPSSSSTSLPHNETDIIERYMVLKMSENVNDIADHNFLLVISQWLVKFCLLSN